MHLLKQLHTIHHKKLISIFIILICFSCRYKPPYQNEFEEYSAHCDTTFKPGNSTYGLLVDSLSKELTNFGSLPSGMRSPGAIEETSFIRPEPIYSSYIGRVTISMYKNDRLAFDTFAQDVIAFTNDSISVEGLKNFKNVNNILYKDINMIYLENIIIRLMDREGQHIIPIPNII